MTRHKNITKFKPIISINQIKAAKSVGLYHKIGMSSESCTSRLMEMKFQITWWRHVERGRSRNVLKANSSYFCTMYIHIEQITVNWIDLYGMLLFYKNEFIKKKHAVSRCNHAVSRTLQGRQKAPSVKTLRSPLSAEFWRHCVLIGRTQRRTCSRHQSEEMKIWIEVNISFPRVGIEPTTSRFTVTLYTPAPQLAS